MSEKYGVNGHSSNTEEFVRKAILKHGDGVFDYSKVSYVHSKTKVDIGCITCGGWFKQKPNSHLSARGCPNCSKKKQGPGRHTQDTFLEKCLSAHGNKYDYSLSKYVKTGEKVCIICPKHGEFWQTPHLHFRGAGCPNCYNETRGESKNSKSASTFLTESRAIHGEKYDYSRVDYKYSDEYVLIGCRKCGEDFKQTPAGHKSGYGCPTCAANARGLAKRNTTDKFISNSIAKHGKNRFIYDRVVYEKVNTKVEMGCVKCGSYWRVTPAKHLEGHGCPSCADYGFNPNKEARLYILEFENITKVGITNRDTEVRIKEINKESGNNFTVYKQYQFPSGKTCSAIESEVLHYLRSIYESPKEKYTGSTECFIDVDKTRLCLEINRALEGVRDFVSTEDE